MSISVLIPDEVLAYAERKRFTSAERIYLILKLVHTLAEL